MAHPVEIRSYAGAQVAAHAPAVDFGRRGFQAPSRETRRRLKSLIAAGRNYTVAYFANAEHGMTLFDVDRRRSHFHSVCAGLLPADTGFRVVRQGAGDYGDAELTRPPPPLPR